MFRHNPNHVPTSPTEIVDVINFYAGSIAAKTSSTTTLVTIAVLLQAINTYEQERMHDFLTNNTDRGRHVLNTAYLFHKRFENKLIRRSYASEALFLNIAICAYELGVIADLENIEFDKMRSKMQVIDETEELNWVDSPLLFENFVESPDAQAESDSEETVIDYRRLTNSPASEIENDIDTIISYSDDETSNMQDMNETEPLFSDSDNDTSESQWYQPSRRF